MAVLWKIERKIVNKIFFDTEFTGLHKDTTLISIGLISEDGRQFYGECTDYDITQCDEWIKENVLKHTHFSYGECHELNIKEDIVISNYHLGNKFSMKTMITNWLRQFDTVEFVSDVCHYDFVLLIDLFGSAFDLPKQCCAACYDINQDIARKFNISQQEAFDKSREDILYNAYKENAVKGEKHNALYDAKVIRELYQILNNVNFNI